MRNVAGPEAAPAVLPGRAAPPAAVAAALGEAEVELGAALRARRADARLVVPVARERVEGLDAAEIRLAASRASRPLWLDVQPGGQAPTGDALSGAHLLL